LQQTSTRSSACTGGIILHFRAKVSRVGAVTLGIHHAKYPKRRGLGYFVPKYPQKGQEYTKSGNTPKNTPGIPNGVFNPGYFLSFLRSAARLPDESRYGENRGKKSCLRRKQWEKCCVWGGGEGEGGGARACVHAPFDLPPIA
jgi:hypothetical protein